MCHATAINVNFYQLKITDKYVDEKPAMVIWNRQEKCHNSISGPNSSIVFVASVSTSTKALNEARRNLASVASKWLYQNHQENAKMRKKITLKKLVQVLKRKLLRNSKGSCLLEN